MIWKMLLSLIFLLWMSSSVSGLTKGNVTNEPCSPSQFKCNNGKCLDFKRRCDGYRGDCGGADFTDEASCNRELWEFHRFERYERVRLKAAKWLVGQIAKKSELRSRGYNPVRAALTLYMINETYFYHGNSTGKTASSELQIHILSKLAHQSVDDIDLNELASFVNALIAVCLDPREFYGMDLVAKLRARVDSAKKVNHFPFIALCNARVPITESDFSNFHRIYFNDSKPLWTDMEAMVVMAASCAVRQSNSTTFKENLLMYYLSLRAQLNQTRELVDNMKTTGLLLQALIASGNTHNTPNLIVDNIFFALPNLQEEDGSFGDMLKTYYLLPIFNWKSLIDINNAHCTEKLIRRRRIEEAYKGVKVKIQYSLWLGTSKYLETTLILRTLANEKFYDVMKLAEQIDERYRFNVTMKSGKPYVYSISGIEDDPERGNLWYLYKVKKDETTELIKESPIDYLPEKDDHLVYWLRKVPSFS